MEIAWQRLPIKGRGGGPPLMDDPELRNLGYAPPWGGLRCDHHGGGRLEWTPFVVEDERCDGQIRQKLVFRLPSIRSCCIADDFNRAAWWHDLELALKLWGESDEGNFDAELNLDRRNLLAGLRAVIPRPTPAGLRDFADFRSERDTEDKARDRANQAYWQERLRLLADQDGPRPGQHHHSVPSGYFAVLGLKSSATLSQLKARHRELVKRHHPDRGGEAARFREVQDAYERAVADFERRADG